MGLQPKSGDFVGRNLSRTKGTACSKEPDLWFGLYDRRGIVGTLSLLLEVGVSESSKKLRSDARWWYTKTGPPPSVVVLIDTSHGPT